MTVGQKIKYARIQSGFTQKDLANKLGVPYQSIGQWERGLRNPKVSSLNRIAAALDVPPISLYPEDSTSGAELSTGILVYANAGKITLTPESQEELNRRKRQFMHDEDYKRVSEEIDALLDDYEDHKEYPSELILLQAYHKLNSDGQKKAIEQLEILLGNPKYSLGGDNHAPEE